MTQSEMAWGTSPGLLTLLDAGRRHRGFILAVTGLVLAATVVYSFLVVPIYTAQVTILPKQNAAPAGLLGNLASMVGAGVSAEGTYELLYNRILVSDRLLDRAIARTWRHADFPEPVSLYRIFGVADPGADMPDPAEHELKGILEHQVIAFRRDKGTSYMVLQVNAPRDGAFAADLANFLVDELDRFNRAIQSRIATEQHAFVTERLAKVEAKLEVSEDELAGFKMKNRAYTSSPELMQRFGEINREVQAQTAIWVELRQQVELAAIEMNKEKSSVDVLDRATPPVVRSKPQRPLYWAAGLMIGFAVAVILVFLRHQVAAIRLAGTRRT